MVKRPVDGAVVGPPKFSKLEPRRTTEGKLVGDHSCLKRIAVGQLWAVVRIEA